jgi:IS605 OrfB family transposase
MNFQHQVSAEVIKFAVERNIGQIFYGDIQTKKLTKSKVASTGMNKSTQGRGSLGRTKQFFQYKAGFNGITFSLVNEAYTSKTNCLTGEIFEWMTLGTRSVELMPGLTIDRDINAAVNIAARGTLGAWSPQMSWVQGIQLTEKYIVS